MTSLIEKIFRFDAGHRALGFDYKKEETIHGHTWRLVVTIEARHELDALSTIFDTNELAVVVKPMIDEVDHSFIMWAEDPILAEFRKVCALAGVEDKLFVVDFNPTLEGLAKYFHERIAKELAPVDVTVRSVRLECATTLSSTYTGGVAA